MITQVNGRIDGSACKDPRRKAQSVQLKNRNYIPYMGSTTNSDSYEKQKNNALWTSVSIVAGSLLFMIGYFSLAALNHKKPV